MSVYKCHAFIFLDQPPPWPSRTCTDMKYAQYEIFLAWIILGMIEAQYGLCKICNMLITEYAIYVHILFNMLHSKCIEPKKMLNIFNLWKKIIACWIWKYEKLNVNYTERELCFNMICRACSNSMKQKKFVLNIQYCFDFTILSPDTSSKVTQGSFLLILMI